MATAKCTTADSRQFKADTTTQEFQVLNTIAANYQRMQQALRECLHGKDNRLLAFARGAAGTPIRA
jgi:hypothetical protein